MKGKVTAGPKIIYDGWPLAYRPNSPAALHLLTVLAAHPADFPAMVGLPGESFHPLPERVDTFVQPAPDTGWSRLRWEQRRLPARLSAALTHHIGDGGPALFGSARALVSPADFAGSDLPAAKRSPGFAGRLRDAFAQGGQARAVAMLWPDDLPEPAVETRVHRLPPAIHPLFDPGARGPARTARAELEALNLPETYLLYHGPGDEAGLHRLLDAWSWAAGSIGGYFPLLLVGLDRLAQDRLAALLAEYQLTDTARPLPMLSLPALAAVYRGCSALFHPGQISPWGDPVRLALACGKPVVGLDGEYAAALMGPAGYLIAPDQSYAETCRALGAALITVIVEESLADSLSRAARQQAAAWSLDSFSGRLRECYATYAP